MKCQKCRTDNLDDSRFCRGCGATLEALEGPPQPGAPAPNKPSPGLKDKISFTKTLETATDELARGTLFAGRYEIIEELGVGGMGRVYRAYDKKIEEEVALKLIRPEIAAEKRTVERFRNEIKTARKITHKNVCRTHDLGEEGKNLFITMEYVRGEDLKSLIRRTRILAPGTAVSIARQVAEGLGEAHSLDVVHRDLKPGNIMIDKDGNAKIMDFGIARLLTRTGTTAEGAVIGTPEYMSPEQVEGKPADVRADIYALGVILFEMVTGQPPFDGETSLAIAHKHKYEPAPDPRMLNPQVPEDLGRLILRCLEKDRETRYQTTAELLVDLEAVEASLPTTERTSKGRVPTKPKPATSKTITVKITPRKLIIPAAALLALVIGVVVVWHPWSHGGGPPVFTSDRPSIAILNFANRTGQRDLDDYKIVFPDSINIKLSQSKYIYVVPQNNVNSALTRLGLLEADTFTKENLRDIGRLAFVKYLASGYYTKAGEKFLVRLIIQEAESGTVVGNEEVQGESINSLFAMVNELALKIKPNLELTGVEVANDVDSLLERDTTSSPEAYRYFILARKLSNGGKFREAIETMEKAVAIDPEFAMAYRSLGALYYLDRQPAEARKNLDKALEIADRSDRISLREKLNIQGYARRDSKGQFEAFSRLIELYPEDARGNATLGLWYSNREEFEKAIERYEVPVKNRDNGFTYYFNLAFVYCKMGEYAKAENVLKGYIREFQDLAIMHSQLSGVYTAEAKYKLALAEAEAALRLDPSLSNGIIGLKGAIFQLQGKFDKAEAEFRKLLSETDVRLHLDTLENNLTPLYITQGMFQRAKEILNQGIELANKANLPQRVTSSKLALIDVHYEAGEIETAEAGLSKLWKEAEALGKKPEGDINFLWLKTKNLVKKKSFEDARAVCDVVTSMYQKYENKKEMRIPYYLQGEIELEMGNHEKAAELLAKAKSLLPPGQGLSRIAHHALLIDALALAFFRSGNLERARQEYEGITGMTYGRYIWGDVYAKSFYMLGQVYEQMGKKKQARANYSKFLDLWKNADPGRPEVEDAKKRLAGL